MIRLIVIVGRMVVGRIVVCRLPKAHSIYEMRLGYFGILLLYLRQYDGYRFYLVIIYIMCLETMFIALESLQSIMANISCTFVL